MKRLLLSAILFSITIATMLGAAAACDFNPAALEAFRQLMQDWNDNKDALTDTPLTPEYPDGPPWANGAVGFCYPDEASFLADIEDNAMGYPTPYPQCIPPDAPQVPTGFTMNGSGVYQQEEPPGAVVCIADPEATPIPICAEAPVTPTPTGGAP